MKKFSAALLLLSAGFGPLYVCAQPGIASSSPADAVTIKHNDSIILAQVIEPLVLNSGGEVPNWDVLAADVKAKYGDSYVDRTVTKAKIYYYYGKNWPLFSKALIHYTEAWEDKDDLKLMNKNAKMVLQFSQDPDEWKTAVVWIKHAVDKEPGNTEYKETYDALTTKIKGKVAMGDPAGSAKGK